MLPGQTTIPGAEPITEAELAKRRASLPLKPKAAQRACDHGLFSDEAAQVDLLDLLRK